MAPSIVINIMFLNAVTAFISIQNGARSSFTAARYPRVFQHVTYSTPRSSIPFYASEVKNNEVNEIPKIHVQSAQISEMTTITTPAAPKVVVKKKGKNPAHKEGVFSPVVISAKKVIGDQRLNQVRGKVISLHSTVIDKFVSTSDTNFGKGVLKLLFGIADRNGDGKLDEEEIRTAFEKLGFTWLKEKQVSGIMKRADVDNDGSICIDEFTAEAPRTLRTNLTKLAKKNGGDMGLLS